MREIQWKSILVRRVSEVRVIGSRLKVFFRSDLFRFWNISFVLVTLHVSCQMFFPGGKNWKSSSDYPWCKMLGKGDCSSRNW